MDSFKNITIFFKLLPVNNPSGWTFFESEFHLTPGVHSQHSLAIKQYKIKLNFRTMEYTCLWMELELDTWYLHLINLDYHLDVFVCLSKFRGLFILKHLVKLSHYWNNFKKIYFAFYQWNEFSDSMFSHQNNNSCVISKSGGSCFQLHYYSRTPPLSHRAKLWATVC